MIDPLSAGLEAIGRHDLARLPIVVLAGVVTSIGPCVAPRYIAVVALLERSHHRGVTTATFVAGMLLAYAALGLGVGVLGTLWQHTEAVYIVLACTLVTVGLATVVHPVPACAAGHDHRRPMRRASAVFLLGAASAFVVSPCCTPIVAAVAGMTAFDGTPITSALFLAAFAVGHALPLFFAGSLGALVTSRMGILAAGPTPSLVSGTLMIGLGLYYGVLV